MQLGCSVNAVVYFRLLEATRIHQAITDVLPPVMVCAGHPAHSFCAGGTGVLAAGDTLPALHAPSQAARDAPWQVRRRRHHAQNLTLCALPCIAV
jgi:hypothetical protein